MRGLNSGLVILDLCIQLFLYSSSSQSLGVPGAHDVHWRVVCPEKSLSHSGPMSPHLQWEHCVHFSLCSMVLGRHPPAPTLRQLKVSRDVLNTLSHSALHTPSSEWPSGASRCPQKQADEPGLSQGRMERRAERVPGYDTTTSENYSSPIGLERGEP